MKNNLRVLSTAVVALLLVSTGAQATNKVSSPDVTKGRWELEYRGGFDQDETTSKDDVQTHKFVTNYGISDRWRTEFKGVAAGHSDDVVWTYLEWSNRYQVFKENESWVKLALQENYKFALQDGSADKFEIAILASKDLGKFTHITNINFENEIGANARGGTDLNLGWKTKYKYSANIEPGGEFYADFGKFGSPNSVTPNKYQLGPTVSGKISDSAKYDVGYLFGLTHAVPDGRLKIILTYGF